MKEELGWNPAHGIRLECTCVVVLNALGYIGFKVKTSNFKVTIYSCCGLSVLS